MGEEKGKVTSECTPGSVCQETHDNRHPGHEQWHMVSLPGAIWCRTCQVEYVPQGLWVPGRFIVTDDGLMLDGRLPHER